MKHILSIALAVSSLLFMGNSHAQLLSSILDPSDGACDPYTGLANLVCSNAYRTNDTVERLSAQVEGNDNASWLTLWWLDIAERRLEAQKAEFERLTGEQIPGLSGCPFPPSTFAEQDLLQPPVDVGRSPGLFCKIGESTPLGLVFGDCIQGECNDAYKGTYWLGGVYIDSATGNSVEYGNPEAPLSGAVGGIDNTTFVDGELTQDEFNACLIDYGCPTAN